MAPLSSPSSPYDPLYDSLVAKYTAMSQNEKLRERAGGGSSRQQQQQQQEYNRLMNGHPVPAIAARTEDEKLVLAAESPSTVPPAADSAHRGAAADAAAAAKRRAAKVECLVSALWAMSSLGGSPYFQAETEAVVTILIRCLASAAVSAAGAAARQTATAAAAAAPLAAGGGGGGGGLSGWQAGQVLWALGNSRHVSPRLPDLEASLLRSGGLSYMQPRDVTRVLWGFASLGYKPERLLLTIRPDWSWWECTASERESVHSRKAKARGKGMKGNGSGSGLEVGKGDVRSFSPQQLACAVWALAVMEKVDTGPFRSAWVQLLRRTADVPPSEPVLTQIWQTNLAIHLESSSSSPTAQSSSPHASATSAPPTPIDGGRVAGTVPIATSASRPVGRGNGGGGSSRAAIAAAAEDLTTAGLAAAAAGGDVDVAAARSLLLRSRDVFLAATSALRRKVQSGYQRQMANTLTGLRMMHLLEDNSAGYSIDITLPQLRIALEADGPTHISRTPGGAVLGATAMKRRHLQRMGWHVVNVTYKEWDKLTSESARRAFLQERINEALLSRIQIGDEDGESNDDREAAA
ncbi:hypothetical protein Vretimale_10067 [Volvox reticuliferus]|nr:hypothetical protein Vretifemale_765 [Volvox reticuliferus]GIM05618.1 hypothetical protein Vretimale_10067 [Volvox reticuliferus]